MAKRIWTASQQAAIEARGGTLLLSAAAGSGKTSVLVERVIRRICDHDHPCTADRLLVVTFTKAAASEMKDRISKRLSALIAKNPNDVWLQRQQALLPKARISTIHRFCSELIREYFHLLDVSPNFKIADPSEIAVLREQAIETVMAEFYQSRQEAFTQLAELIGMGRDDSNVAKAIVNIYDFVCSHPFPKQWLDNQSAMYRTACAVGGTPWGKVILTYVKNALYYCTARLEEAVAGSIDCLPLRDAYIPSMVDGIEKIGQIIDVVEQSKWDETVIKLRDFQFERFKALKHFDDETQKERIISARDEVKETMKKLATIFLANEAECAEDFKSLAPPVSLLFEAVKQFMSVLDELKAAKNAVDFNDLEQLTLRLLVAGQDGAMERTAIADELSAQIDEILVDEYQDTNETQDMIFRSISNDERNLFMVGDVKQSIYRFRQAKPELFLSHLNHFHRYDGKHFPATIYLSNNFRSRKGVTDGINFIFSQIMSRELGELDYTEQEQLQASADYPQSNEAAFVLDIVDGENKRNTLELEAVHVARRVKEMMDSGITVTDPETGQIRSVRYKDICILLRSASQSAKRYVKELVALDIPAWADVRGGFFGTIEISVTLSLLRVIDNPIQDVPLLSVLVSPIYGFTPDDLAKIRLCQPKVPLYFAVRYAAQSGDEKCQSFLQSLERMRRLAVTLPADQLISHVYEETGYLAMVLVLTGGEMRQANLMLLLEYAKKYEHSGHKGLSGFIRFIDRLQNSKSDLSAASALSESADVVRVMTIHHSKGLEFPVCILAGCGKRFNRDSVRGGILLHSELGIGMTQRGKDGRRFSTIPQEAIALELERDNLSEEMRVLYVAMTRAKEKLIMVMTLKDPGTAVKKAALCITDNVNIEPYALRRSGGFYEWILAPALLHPDGAGIRALCGFSVSLPDAQTFQWEINVKKVEMENGKQPKVQTETVQPDEDFLNLVRTRLAYQYPFGALSKIPAKASVSSLIGSDMHQTTMKMSVPAFINDGALTPMQAGSALHRFMQICDFHQAGQDAGLEVERLYHSHLLSESEYSVLSIEKIKTFFCSNLFQRINQSNFIRREMAFTVSLPASALIEDKDQGQARSQDQFILQGVVDLLFEEDDGLVIVDYKTDQVKSETILIERYAKQLCFYARAMEQCIGKKVKQCIIYSLTMGKEIIL